MSVQLSGYGVAHWNRNGWRVDRLVVVLLALSVLLSWSFELWTVFLRAPYTYFSISVVFVPLNFLPVMLLVYLVARTRTKGLQQYALMGSDPASDYKLYQQQMTAQQQAQRVAVPGGAPRNVLQLESFLHHVDHAGRAELQQSGCGGRWQRAQGVVGL